MKLVKKRKDGSTATLKVAEKKQPIQQQLPPWKVLIVDDEHDVHVMTLLSLKEFIFAERPLQIVQAYSGIEAREILKREKDIAVALVDIVMETDDAGLQLINFIRNELKYNMIRLIVRTGQPGMAPEKTVIEEYDIDDYKSKTELRADKLFLTMRVTLKAYRDLLTLDANRRALRKILEAVPKFHHAQSLTQFFNGVLSQLIGLCNLGENSLIYSVNSGLVITTSPNENTAVIQSGTGRFAPTHTEEVERVRQLCLERILGKTPYQILPENALLIPLAVKDEQIGFVYLENALHLTQADLDLVQIMVQQCSSALENLRLYMDLKEANKQTLKMLEVAEQARQEAEIANHAKSQFLATMSHELRTPLNAILGYSEMLEDTAVDLDQQDEYIDDLHKIQSASYRLLNMINEVLDFSKLDTGQMLLCLTQFKLQVLLDDVIATMQPLIEEAYNQFELHIDNPEQLLDELQTDKTKLHQILVTLLSNATKFTEHGKIQLQVSWQQESVEFKVIDNGIGMTQEQSKQLFTPFMQADMSSTRRYEGTGLGLAISAKLTKILGGTLMVESELKRGSTFTLSIPKIAPTPPKKHPI